MGTKFQQVPGITALLVRVDIASRFKNVATRFDSILVRRDVV